MAQEIKKDKKWHQKWWGIVVLLVFTALILYIGTFIYQVVSLVEAQNQLLADSYNAGSSDGASAINSRDLLEKKDAPYFGLASAKIVIVEFSDFQCPYCQQAYPILKRIRQEYKDSVKIIYRDFPNLVNHPDALNAALAVNCAFEQSKFVVYHDLLFDNQANLSVENLKNLAQVAGLDLATFDQCLDSQKYLTKIQNDLQEGVKFELTGTPTFFINGFKIAGVIPYDTLKAVIEELLKADLQNSP
jgi:protein-disulfide isomerase